MDKTQTKNESTLDYCYQKTLRYQQILLKILEKEKEKILKEKKEKHA